MNGWPSWVGDLPREFDFKFLGVALWQWLGFVVVFFVAYVAFFVGRAIAVVVIRLRARFLTTPMTSGTQKAVRRATGALIAVMASSEALDELYLVGKPHTVTEKLLTAAMISAIVLLLYAVWDSICDDVAHHLGGNQRAEGLLVPMARKLIQAIIIVVGVLFGATTLLNADVRGILASLGIGGIVIALAAKDSVENIFGSFTILFDMPFAIGDTVKIPPVEGVVEEINLRSTRIRTFEDTLITLPNANLIRASVENISARRARRQQLMLRLAYGCPTENLTAFCNDVEAWLNAQPGVVEGKSIVQLSELSETAIGVLVQCQFEVKTQAEELSMRHALIAEIFRLHDQHKVPFVADKP